MNNAPNWKVYVMGPGVFRKDAHDFFGYVRKLAVEYDFQPLIPWSPQLHEPAQIYENCVRMMREADAGVVDLNPFRGVEPDSGSVFETGFMLALGKPVVGYSLDGRTVLQRTKHFFADHGMSSSGPWFPDGMGAENFERSHNLMLTQSMSIRPTLAEAFAVLEQRLASMQQMQEMQRLTK